MKSLRTYVMVGALLWTLGLLGMWGVLITFHRQRFQFLAAVHGYPHTLLVGALAVMVFGFAIVRRGIKGLKVEAEWRAIPGRPCIRRRGSRRARPTTRSGTRRSSRWC